MTQAERIIAKFGGLAGLAKALGHKNPTTVQGWRERGFIPARQQQEVLDAALTLKIRLSPADFFDATDEQKGAEPPPVTATHPASGARNGHILTAEPGE